MNEPLTEFQRTPVERFWDRLHRTKAIEWAEDEKALRSLRHDNEYCKTLQKRFGRYWDSLYGCDIYGLVARASGECWGKPPLAPKKLQKAPEERKRCAQDLPDTPVPMDLEEGGAWDLTQMAVELDDKDSVSERLATIRDRRLAVLGDAHVV